MGSSSATVFSSIYEVYGDGAPTVMLLPTWSIVHSRVWKAQIPYLARHFRVVTFDGRGCGRSTRPVGAEAYTREQFADDAVAVLDATDTDHAVLVGLSAGARWGIQLAAVHPDRVLGFVSIAPAAPLVPDHAGRAAVPFDEPFESTSGWAKFNSHYWAHDYAGFVEFFIGRMFTEAHSTKPIEDAVAWGLDNNAATLADTYRGVLATDPHVVPEGLRTGVVPRTRDPRRRGRRPPARRGRRVGGGHRRPVGDDRRGRTRPQRPRSRRRQPVDPRVRRVGRSARQGRTPMRAREPDASGFVERGAVRVWWERFGEGDPAILFFGGDAIVESRMWKAQSAFVTHSVRQ